jgi:hypothetical protein
MTLTYIYINSKIIKVNNTGEVKRACSVRLSIGLYLRPFNKNRNIVRYTQKFLLHNILSIAIDLATPVLYRNARMLGMQWWVSIRISCGVP